MKTLDQPMPGPFPSPLILLGKSPVDEVAYSEFAKYLINIRANHPKSVLNANHYTSSVQTP